MAWTRRPLVRALLLGLLAQLAIADTEAKADADTKAKVQPPTAGSAEGLVSEQIEKIDIITGNATKPATGGKIPPVMGWWESKICSGEYCVFTNRKVANGRGLAAVTHFEDFQKLERVDDHLNKGENKLEDPTLLEETEIVDKGIGFTASKNLRRGKKLASWSPVLIVHKDLFVDVKKKADRARLLEAAAAFLPDETRAKFDRQRMQGLAPGEGRKKRSIEDILLGAPFEINLGYEMHAEKHSRHYVNYPEMAPFGHDCRPNVAFHIDNNFAMRTTVARRTSAGEELTITYIDPFLPKYKRQAWVRKHRGLGKECSCKLCSLKGDEAKKAAARERELHELHAELRNHDSKIVTEEMIDRYLTLVDQERIQTRLAESYEYAALNYNYLGFDKKAKKYADLAVQAGIIESGPEGNEVIANRIFASDVKGHYSYRFTLKRREKEAKK